jgi:glycosyltransferase involved in cell wall biosynthesis
MRSPALHDLPAPPDAMTVWPWTRASRPLPAAMPDGSPWPRVSIVMPSFNHAAYLEQAIRSVLLQGYPALELIVMDGGSADGSVAILEKYDPWLEYWHSQPDRGPADCLARGFARASGEVFAFLNADDFYLPDCLATVVPAFGSGADVVSGHGYFAEPAGHLRVPAFSDPWSLTTFRYGACVLVQPATFFTRDAYQRAGGFRQSNSLCWDMELWADMAAVGARFESIDAFLAAFRIHGGSITGNPGNRLLRRQHARLVMARSRGRAETRADRALQLVHRALKFSRHPFRTLRQRAFFYSTIKRWSV